jgi:hypothetical protein
VVQTGEEDIAVNCRKLIITTGFAPALPDMPGIKLPNVITRDEAQNGLNEVQARTFRCWLVISSYVVFIINTEDIYYAGSAGVI